MFGAGPAPAPELAVELPEQFAADGAGGAYEPLAWWESFADPALNRVVEAALESSFDLAGAVARLDQARARARITNAARLPSISPVAGVSDVDLATNAGIGAQLDELGLGDQLSEQFGVALPDRLGLTTYSLGAEFAWEADFRGRNRNLRLAAGAEQFAAESDFHAARIAVLAESVGTYLELIDLRRQRELALEQIDLLAESAALTQSRYEGGLVEAEALYAARRALNAARARLPQQETAVADAESRLWILLGGYRQDIAAALPERLTIAGVGEPVPAGIPADLLVQRPDIASARQRMEATRFALGAREAELLPTLSLSGSIGLQATDAGDWFDPDQWFRNLGVNLLGPAFQGSRLRDNVELAEARLSEAAAAYGLSVVTAVHEVEAALAALQAARRSYDVLSSWLEETRAESGLQRQRYAAGVGSYAEVLLAAQMVVGARGTLSSAEKDLGFARLAVHRALGGAWTDAGPESLRLSETAGDPDETARIVASSANDEFH